MNNIRAGLCALLLAFVASTHASAQTNVVFIVDASGSMKKAVGGESRMDAAKRVLGQTLREMPKEARLGLMVYGHRRAKDCKDIELISPVGADDAGKIATQIAALQPKGETPIAGALEQAARSFTAFKGQSNSIVLVTDGIEECNGDPCAAAKAIKGAGLDLKVNIVGFTLNDKERAAIACVAKETGGVYYDAKDARALTAALGQVRQQIAQAPAAPAVPAPRPPEEFNLLAPANGGQVLAAPEATWSGVLSGKEDEWVGAVPGNEGIFAFKDEGPAKFDKFTILVPKTGPWVKEFELLAADEVAGPYQSLGQFTTQNLRMLKTPYQEFKFAETTARYLKIKVISGHDRTTGGWHLLPQVRLVGKLEPASASAPKAASAAASQVNLLAPANGGQILAAPDPKWTEILSGKEDDWVGAVPGNEVIFAFKGERPAIFDTFRLLIPKAGPWVKDFELLAADEVGGPYRSLGTFTSQNLRLIQTPYQSFKFAPVTAKYIKLKVISGFDRTAGGWHLLTQVQLMGKAE
jgi:Mg-chelatase subunit ChlD